MRLSRRDFLKGIAAGAVSTALVGMTGCAADEPAADTAASAGSALDSTTAATDEPPENEQPDKAPSESGQPDNARTDPYDWADAADVVVVGGGGAGFCAAIEAARAGSSVLILEKSGFCGGNTALSGGMILAAGTPEQAELAGYTEDTPERFAEQQVRYAMGYADEEMIREMCLESAESVRFMSEQGRVYKQVDIVPPVWGMDDDTTWAPRCHWDNANNTGHFVILSETASKLDNVRILTNTEAAELLVNEQREVIGVRTKNGDAVRAGKGVVLSTGSFDLNLEMSQSFNQMNYWALSIVNKTNANTARSGQCSTNTGDGIRMAMKLGADLKLSEANCMADRQYFGGVGYGIINDMFGVSYKNPYNSTPIKGMILVNGNGQRYVQEDADWGYVTQETFKETRRLGWTPEKDTEIWAIIDSACIGEACLAYANTTGEDNYAAMVKSADTLEELAQAIGMDGAHLTETVERWNGFCDQEKDEDFDRRTDFGRIEKGPFYAMPYVPNPMGSFGGLRTNRDTQVLDVSGAVIPRLYAAGTTMSGMYTGPFYPGCGYSILGTVHWGRKAGRTAAAETSWATEPVESRLTAEEDEMVEGTGDYNPGVYSATASGMNGDVKVNVTFSETSITGVQVLEHSETEGIGDNAVNELPGLIVRKQSVEIDGISGATMTSNAIKEAVADCIAQASK